MQQVGIAQKIGMGKPRRLKVSQVWAQDCVAQRDLRIVKGGTRQNLAHVSTKHAGRVTLDRYMDWCQLWTLDVPHTFALGT